MCKTSSAPAQGQVSAALTGMRLLQKDKLHPLLLHLLPPPPHSLPPMGLCSKAFSRCQPLSLGLPCLQKLSGEFLASSSYLTIPTVSAGHGRPTGCVSVPSSFVAVGSPFSGDAHVLTAPISYYCREHGGPTRSSELCVLEYRSLCHFLLI